MRTSARLEPGDLVVGEHRYPIPAGVDTRDERAEFATAKLAELGYEFSAGYGSWPPGHDGLSVESVADARRARRSAIRFTRSITEQIIRDTAR